jgi:hypothetical protein
MYQFVQLIENDLNCNDPLKPHYSARPSERSQLSIQMVIPIEMLFSSLTLKD